MSVIIRLPSHFAVVGLRDLKCDIAARVIVAQVSAGSVIGENIGDEILHARTKVGGVIGEHVVVMAAFFGVAKRLFRLGHANGEPVQRLDGIV